MFRFAHYLTTSPISVNRVQISATHAERGEAVISTIYCFPNAVITISTILAGPPVTVGAPIDPCANISYPFVVPTFVAALGEPSWIARLLDFIKLLIIAYRITLVP